MESLSNELLELIFRYAEFWHEIPKVCALWRDVFLFNWTPTPSVVASLLKLHRAMVTRQIIFNDSDPRDLELRRALRSIVLSIDFRLGLSSFSTSSSSSSSYALQRDSNSSSSLEDFSQALIALLTRASPPSLSSSSSSFSSLLLPSLPSSVSLWTLSSPTYSPSTSPVLLHCPLRSSFSSFSSSSSLSLCSSFSSSSLSSSYSSNSISSSYDASSSQLEVLCEAIFLLAVSLNEARVVQGLFHSPALRSSLRCLGKIALTLAVTHSFVSIASFLLSDSSIRGLVNPDKLLLLAIEHGRSEIVKLLLEGNFSDELIFQETRFARPKDFLELKEEELEAQLSSSSSCCGSLDLEFDSTSFSGMTIQPVNSWNCDPACQFNYPIRIASRDGHLEIVKLLLKDPRVDPSAICNRALGLACQEGRLEVASLLLGDPRVDPSGDNNFAIRSASACGHTEIVRLLLFDPRVDPTHMSIFKASENGHLEVVRLLLSCPKVDPSIWHDYPLRIATSNGHTEVVRLLLSDSRVDPASLLRENCFIHHPEIIKCLLQDSRIELSDKIQICISFNEHLNPNPTTHPSHLGTEEVPGSQDMTSASSLNSNPTSHPYLHPRSVSETGGEAEGGSPSTLIPRTPSSPFSCSCASKYTPITLETYPPSLAALFSSAIMPNLFMKILAWLSRHHVPKIMQPRP